MPRRTNKYQKLILFLSRQFASETSTVTESKMLWDSVSEQNREVDIIIEESAGLYPFIIGIECTAQKTKFGIKQIEQIHQKHKNLNIGKTVIVSEAGFVPKGHTYAKKNNITLLTFEMACKMEWPEWLKHDSETNATYISFKCLDANLDIHSPSSEAFEHTEKLYLQSAELGKHEAHAFIFAYYRSNRLNKTDGKKQVVSEVWQFSPPIDVINSLGQKALCGSIALTYSCMGADLDMKYNEFNNKPVIHGVAETEDEFKHVGITMAPSGEQLPNGKPTFSVTIHADTE